MTVWWADVHVHFLIINAPPLIIDLKIFAENFCLLTQHKVFRVVKRPYLIIIVISLDSIVTRMMIKTHISVSES